MIVNVYKVVRIIFIVICSRLAKIKRTIKEVRVAAHQAVQGMFETNLFRFYVTIMLVEKSIMEIAQIHLHHRDIKGNAEQNKQ
jgi:hypothetical protein